MQLISDQLPEITLKDTSMSRDVKEYNLIARLLHWLSAIVIVSMFGVGIWMVNLTYYSHWYHEAPFWHKSVGIILALFTIFRVVWKSVTLSPKVTGSRFEQIASKAIHHAMYLDLFIIFISGYLISTADGRSIEVFNWFSIPGAGQFFEGQADFAGVVHTVAAWSLIAMAVLHALAALKHHFISKDDTLRKMIGATKK
jgi:cytochrome b561